MAIRGWVPSRIVLRMRMIEVVIILVIVRHGLGLLPLVVIIKIVGIVIIRIRIWIWLIVLLVSRCATIIGIDVILLIVSDGRRVRSIDTALWFDIWVAGLILRDVIVVFYLRVVALILRYSASIFMFIDRTIFDLFLYFFSIDPEHTI